ncbi:MAG TPA: hypothetical protein VJP79_00930 [Nitrososphaera sp.]|nr:hypothetical protein [Nitrososphaera sp.]
MLIKREVFEKVTKPWFEYTPEVPEDHYFCEKARAAGFEIKVDTAIILDHIGAYSRSSMTVNSDGDTTNERNNLALKGKQSTL